MNHLPPNWKSERLKNRVKFAYGDSLATEDRNEGDIPVFGSNGIVGSHDQAITNGCTIIIGRKGSFGKVTWCNTACFPIDTTYFVDNSQTKENLRWLFYALESLQLDTVNFDSAVPGLSREVAYSLHLVFPPLDEQERIAAYLDASCAAIDAAVATKRRQLETLRALRKSTGTRAVMKGLNHSVKMQRTDVAWIPEIPQHWRLVRVKDVMDFFNTVRIPLSAAERGVMAEKVYDYYGASGVIDKVEGYLFDGTYILIAEDGANLLTRSKPLAFLASGKFWVNNQ